MTVFPKSSGFHPTAAVEEFTLTGLAGNRQGVFLVIENLHLDGKFEFAFNCGLYPLKVL